MNQGIAHQRRRKTGAAEAGHRDGLGDLAPLPVSLGRGAALLRALEGFDDAFAAALDTERLDPLAPQHREAL